MRSIMMTRGWGEGVRKVGELRRGGGGGPRGGRGCGMWGMGMWMWEMVMGKSPRGEGVVDVGDVGDRLPGDAVSIDTTAVVRGEETHPHAHQHGGGVARRVTPFAMVRL